MKRLFAIIAFMLAIGAANASDPARTFSPTSEEKVSLMGKVEYLDDPKGEFSIEQIHTSKGEQFKLLDKTKKFAYDYQNQVLWLRVAIDTSQYKKPEFFLIYDYEHIGDLKVFAPTESGAFDVRHMNEAFPKEGRERDIRHYSFRFKKLEAQGPQYYYVRIASHTRLLKVNLAWAGVDGLLETVHQHDFGYGLFFGGMLVLFFYNLSLYAVLRDRSYLYYVYYVGGFQLTFFHVYGYSNFFFKITPFGEALFAAFGYTTIQAMILFARNFLLLKNTTPWLDRYLQAFQWILGLGAVACFFMEVGHQFKWLNYLVLLVIPAIVIAGVKRWWQGYTPARFYTMGWAVFAGALALLALRSVGVLPTNIITNNAVMVACLWEATIFSIALAYRIKLIEKEKNDVLAQERAKLEERVTERTKELQKSLESRKLIIANASHELRTPVNTLSLLVDSSAMAGPERREVMVRVSQIASHMSQLVENLLLIDADQPVSLKGGPTQEFDLGEEIRATCNMLGPMRRDSLATFSYNVDSCLGMQVEGDLVSLRRILINLLSNAFKFTAAGFVTIEARAEEDTENNSVRCILRVKDSGTGISGDMQERIFEPFVTNSLEHGHTGTGLGLAISRKLADNMGGALRLVHSSADQGTEFECTVQFIKADHATAQELPRAQDGAVIVPLKKRLRILVAEDDPIAAEAVQMILRLLNHDVMHVGTFEELKRAFLTAGDAFDVALVDHRLPGGNGLDMIKYCREYKIAMNTRMVLLTADATLEVLEAAKNVCEEVITKPTTAHRLRQLLGDGTPSTIGHERKLIDPTPLTALRSNGAPKASLERITKMFYEATQKTLREINSMPLATTNVAASKPLYEIVHRARSSCATIGATALSAKLQELVTCKDEESLRAQIAEAETVLKSTQAAVQSFLEELQG